MKLTLSAAILLATFSTIVAAQGPAYRRPVKITCLVRYSVVESPWFSDATASGKPLSARYAASDDLPFGTKIYIPYYVRDKRGRSVKKTICRIVADRPRHKTAGVTVVEPYIPRRYEYFLKHVLQGKVTVTIIKPA